MKSFSHISVSVILGACLIHAFYQKIAPEEVIQASDIAVDSLFLTDPVAFEKKQQTALLPLTVTLPQFPSENSQISKKPLAATSTIKQGTADVLKAKQASASIQMIKPKIEVSHLKKTETTPINLQKITAPELPEVASAQIVQPAVEASAATPVTEPASDVQPQSTKKKKFLFFNRKKKDN